MAYITSVRGTECTFKIVALSPPVVVVLRGLLRKFGFLDIPSETLKVSILLNFGKKLRGHLLKY